MMKNSKKTMKINNACVFNSPSKAHLDTGMINLYRFKNKLFYSFSTGIFREVSL